MPKKLEGIEFIDGISNKLYPEHKIKKNMFSENSVDKGTVTREVIMRMYDLYPNYITSNVSVGVIEFSGANGFSNTDLIVSENWNGVESNIVGSHCLRGQMSSTDTESQLDVQTMYWGVPNGELCFEIVDTWLYSWSTEFANRKHIPEVVSLSWGWSETDQCSITHCNNATSKQYIDRCNVEFMKIVARGTTIVVASGDAGSPGRTNEDCSSDQGPNGWNHINAIFPGGSPWVLSVGATFIVQNNGSYAYQTPICHNMTCATGTEEQGVRFDRVGWTSGGGFDHWALMPSWQKALVQKYIKSGVQLPNQKYWNSTTRGYPDLSAIGHNCLIYNQDWENVDGTSCSSPVIAGLIANINSYQKSKGKATLGFVNPLLYKMYTELPSTFNDILIGNSACTEITCCGPDFGFKATRGWDPVGGLGSPNINEIKKYLDQY